jgi:hypothetical protein
MSTYIEDIAKIWAAMPEFKATIKEIDKIFIQVEDTLRAVGVKASVFDHGTELSCERPRGPHGGPFTILIDGKCWMECDLDEKMAGFELIPKLIRKIEKSIVELIANTEVVAKITREYFGVPGGDKA